MLIQSWALRKKKKRYNIVLEAGFEPLKEKLSNWVNDYNLENDE